MKKSKEEEGGGRGGEKMKKTKKKTDHNGVAIRASEYGSERIAGSNLIKVM